jgi:ribonuclease BN (tRNA processing enzyme)
MGIDLHFWGVRGSCAQSGSEYTQGGHTPCVSIHNNDEIVLLDAGTGLVNFSEWFEKNEKPKSLNILLSHLHFDHVLGLPFFAALWHGKHSFEFNIYSTISKGYGGLSNSLSQLIRAPYFPISLTQAVHPVNYHDVDDSKDYSTSCGSFSSHTLNHPGGSSGYAYKTNCGKKVVYLSDSGELNGSMYDSAVEFSKDADVLICDTCFTKEEAENHPTWGHGTVDYACKIANDANVGRLALFHHGLYHRDDQIKILEDDARKLFPNSFSSRQGEIITL